MKKKLTATLPDGTTATRTTDHDYTHILAALRVARCIWVKTETDLHQERRELAQPTWETLSWHGREDLAAKKASTTAANQYTGPLYGDYRIIPVNA